MSQYTHESNMGHLPVGKLHYNSSNVVANDMQPNFESVIVIFTKRFTGRDGSRWNFLSIFYVVHLGMFIRSLINDLYQ